MIQVKVKFQFPFRLGTSKEKEINGNFKINGTFLENVHKIEMYQPGLMKK